jgi:hypothetical protein
MSIVAHATATARTHPFQGAVDSILGNQLATGAIPWFEGGPWDAWNHTECLMALLATGEWDAARAGFEYLADAQQADGAWLGGYGNALPFEPDGMRIARVPAPKVRDTNFTAYPATGLWHAHLSGMGRKFVDRYWPMVRAAIDFVITNQHPEGDISWCSEAHGSSIDDSVLAGNASIYHSLGHAIALSNVVNDHQLHWHGARGRLRDAIRSPAHRFDRIGTDRSGFAMDWYYPILAGALPMNVARRRLLSGQARFIEAGRGCRCVATEPWATVAESAELAMVLIGLGLPRQARTLLKWQDAHRDADGAYWMGWQFELDIAWPVEKPSWTQAAMILAYDALENHSDASRILASGATGG